MSSEEGGEGPQVEAPLCFLCPISRELMNNPVMNMVGQTYEFESISEWFALGKRSDPVTRQPLNDTRLVPNIAIRSQILEWKQQNNIGNKGEDKDAKKTPKKEKKEGKESWRNKPMAKWKCIEVQAFITQIGESDVWEEYADKAMNEKVDGVILKELSSMEVATGFGFSKLHALVLKKAMDKLQAERKQREDEEAKQLSEAASNLAKSMPPKKLKHGIRVLVRTQSSGRVCHLEGRLRSFSRRSDGRWDIQVDAPLLAPKRRTFIYSDNSSEFMIPPEERLQMGVGARVIGPFPDLSAEGGWAWYEGDVKAWDGQKATVQYTDGCTWVARYPASSHMLDIDRSEQLLSLQSLAALGKNVEKVPLIVIREGKKRAPDPLRLGTRVLVRSKGTNDTGCFLEGRLVDWKELKDGKWEFAVDAPLLDPKRHTFVYEKDSSAYLIPPHQKHDDLKISVGARVVGTFDDKAVGGGWAWFEGEVTAWDGTHATVKYNDGSEWTTKYPPREQVMDIRHSEDVLSLSAVEKMDAANIALIVIKEAKRDAPKEMKIGMRVLVRSSGMNSRPCLMEGRLKELKERRDGRWQLTVYAPLANPKPHTFMYSENPSSYVVPPDPELKMEVGVRVVGCFGDGEAEGKWAWYEGDVTAWDGTTATVEYTDSTIWKTQ